MENKGNRNLIRWQHLLNIKLVMKNYLPKNLNTTPQKPSNQLNFRSNFSSTNTENSNISLLMIKNPSIITIVQILYRKPKRYKLSLY